MSKKILKRIDAIILETENMILRCVGYVPSHCVRRFFYRVAGMKIGRGSTLHMGAIFYDIRNIRIGEDTIIGENSVLDGREKLNIGSHVAFASDVMVYNAEHNINDPEFAATRTPVEVGDYVFIGPRAIILPGVKIGRGAVVGAGAVVTKDVSEFEIVGGVPAKVIGERKLKNPTYRLGRAAWFR